MSFVLFVFQTLHYYSLLDSIHANIDAIFLGVFVFAFGWMIVGCIVNLVANGTHIQEWKRWESIANDKSQMNKLKREYEDRFHQGSSISESMKENLKYIMMRQDFIAPVYVPMITESSLRKDFDFAQYLGRCYALTLRNFFTLKTATYLWIIIMFVLWRVSVMLNSSDN